MMCSKGQMALLITRILTLPPLSCTGTSLTKCMYIIYSNFLCQEAVNIDQFLGVELF